MFLKKQSLFRHLFSFFLLFFSFTAINAQMHEWTWMSGDSTPNNKGVYGTKGVGAATNKPASRNAHSAWTDASGNFWIFGGFGYDGAGAIGSLNDLWKYNPGTAQWTWVSGDNTVNNAGTYGTKTIATPVNKPGARSYHSGGVDPAGNFWIFGGLGYDEAKNIGGLNDLWKYNPGTGEWAWMSGDNTRNNVGVYGTQGTSAAANKPGARMNYSGVVDASGNFWVFGGNTPSNVHFNDLWKYNRGTGKWTWISGDSTWNSAGVYGVKGVEARSNKPGARHVHKSVIDDAGNFWVFSGRAFDASGKYGFMNDLWVYKPSSGKWTWLSGDITCNGTGVYGVKGTSAAANKPGSRWAASTWLDTTGNLWVFGGLDNRYNYFNDLWRFSLPTPFISKLSNETTGEDNARRFITERSANGAQPAAGIVYPNPAHNGVTLALREEGLLNTTVKIYITTGQLAGEVLITNGKQYIDLQRFPKGMLTLRFNNGKTVTVIKK